MIMKNRNLLLLFCALCMHLAQGQASPEEAGERYLPVTMQVLMNGGKAREFTVALYRDNEQVALLPPSSHNTFELDLDLDAYFSIRVTKEGYREKTVFVDTHLPANVQEYEPYPCLVDLEPSDKFAHADPFYLDFPSAVVRWDADKKIFDHSDQYLDEIQLKMALLSAQTETE